MIKVLHFDLDHFIKDFASQITKQKIFNPSQELEFTQETPLKTQIQFAQLKHQGFIHIPQLNLVEVELFQQILIFQIEPELKQRSIIRILLQPQQFLILQKLFPQKTAKKHTLLQQTFLMIPYSQLKLYFYTLNTI